MRVVLKVTSSNENYNGGCEYALLDLTPDLASLALRRIAVLKEQKNLDPDIDETYYWAYFVDCYFDPWAESAEDVKEGEGTNSAVGDTLDELKIEDNGVVSVPENFHVAPSQYAAVESEQMVVRADAIAFMAIPKHCSVRVQTARNPDHHARNGGSASALITLVRRFSITSSSSPACNPPPRNSSFDLTRNGGDQCPYQTASRTTSDYVVDHINANMLGYRLCWDGPRSTSFEMCCFSGPPHKTKGASSDGAPLESTRAAEDGWLRACARTPLGWDYLATFSCFSDARLPDRRQPEPSLSLPGLFPHRYSLYPVKHGPATP